MSDDAPVSPSAPPSSVSPPIAPTPLPPSEDRPVAARDRLTTVDALRGAALLGILLVNLLAFSGPSFLYVEPLSYWQGADRWTEWAILVLAEGAFYTMFSLLFGWGFGRWMASRGAAGRGRFARRLGWLLAIGLVHLFAIWIGDILTTYALAGFALLLFAGARPRALLGWGLGLWGVGLLLFGGIVSSYPSSGAERWVALYGSGAFEAIARSRLSQGTESVVAALFYLPQILGLFLLGAWLARIRAFERASALRAAWARSLLVTLPAALALKGIYAAQLLEGDADRRFLLATTLGGPLQGFAYLALLVLLFTSPRRPVWVGALERAFAAAGRAALSNYLAQSVVMTLLFYSYGLGLYGRLGPARGVWIVLALFALQVALSRWWLVRFRFGPAEWLWRSLTYGRAQPWRRADEAHGTS